MARKTPEPVEKPKRGKGRPAYVPSKQNRDTVTIMVAGGIQQQFIAAALGIDLTTLRRHFRFEIDNGNAQVNAQVVARLFKLTETNVRAQEFWLTNRDKKNWMHAQKVAIDQNVTNNLGDRLARAQKQLKAKD